MRLIVMGAGGFVGSAVVRALAPRHEIVAVDRACVAISDTSARIIEGDVAEPSVQDRLISDGCDAVIHLAAVPGGSAEPSPAAAYRTNVAASVAPIDRIAAAGPPPRFLFASSITVFGDPLPALVDDTTRVRPRMVYGAHKAMMEDWVAAMTRRRAILGLSLRLPGIIARPPRPSGLKSAFMSEVFHALRASAPFVSPVSVSATLWLMSAACLVRNLATALSAAPAIFAEPFSITLPAVRTTMGALVNEIARQLGVNPGLVSFEPDTAFQAAFGSQPPLYTPRAQAAGFCYDGSFEDLVSACLRAISAGLARVLV